jgi:hypothetical protein
MDVRGKYTRFLERMNDAGKTIPGFRYVQPDWNNMFTGLEIKKSAAYTAGLGVLAFGAGMAAVNSFADTNIRRTDIISSAEDVGNLGRLSYDAVANAANGSRDLGATGDLVFGLHNMRRGGR